LACSAGRSSDGTCDPPATKIHYHDIIVNNLIEYFVAKKTARQALSCGRRIAALSGHKEARSRNGVSEACDRTCR
jgi:hypothetical protein